MEGTVTQLGLNNYLINNKDKAVSFLNIPIKTILILLKIQEDYILKVILILIPLWLLD